MRAGRANERFYIVKLTKAKNDYGKYKQEYVRLSKKLGGDVHILSVEERIKQGNVDNTEFINIRTYNNPHIEHDHLVEWKGNYYRIMAIEPVRNDREVIITAEREV